MRSLIGGCAAFVLCCTAAQADVQAGLNALQQGDAEAAAAAFQTAFDAGDSEGAFYIGRMLELGIGVEPDIAQARQLYQVASEKGSALAMNRLGLLYLDGTGVIRDYKRGADLVCQAADKGQADAQFNCAVVLSDGRGVEEDAGKGVEYLRKAADQGHIGAMNLLGMAYKTGDAVPADPAEAFKLFSQTADEGNPLGLYEVALAYDEGRGVDANKVKAYAYANVAAALQHPAAAALRDRLEGEFDAAQIDEGQAEARELMTVLQEKAKVSTAAGAEVVAEGPPRRDQVNQCQLGLFIGSRAVARRWRWF